MVDNEEPISTWDVFDRSLNLIEEVIQFNSRSYADCLVQSPEAQRKASVDAFLSHPWGHMPLPSLVFEDGRGRLVGVSGSICKR